MGVRPVTDASATTASGGDPGNWQLRDDIARYVQGLLVSGYASLPAARALFLELGSGGGAWLKALQDIVPITAADGPQQPAAMIAFTCTGLAQLGVPATALSSFLVPFQEGMLQKDRRHRLGDDNEKTLTNQIPAWSGNGHEKGEPPPATTTVHALLVLYEETDAALQGHVEKIVSMLADHQVKIVRHMPLDLQLDAEGIAHEHFGFADGISQPVPFAPEVVTKDKREYPCDLLHGVPLGDVLLGYTNAHGEIPPGPVVAGPSRVGGTLQAVSSGTTQLDLIDGSAGLHDLGRNGTYLVVRELKQDVAAFWASMDREAQSLNDRAGATKADAAKVDAEWLAARVVGRTIDGDLLCPAGHLPQKGGEPDNGALFFRDDRLGFGCPMGSHVRRANPRDGLANDAVSCGDLLRAANNHRILRRGRKFGPKIADPRKDDGEERGLLFMCINTDIERQFEFVQQNWLLNPNFATLYQEVDPLVGPAGPMTLPKEPLRRKVDVDTYVKFTGGEYFFMPSLKALVYFAALPPLPVPETANMGKRT
jgi:deferrochelatase/peroxidase EfeB